MSPSKLPSNSLTSSKSNSKSRKHHQPCPPSPAAVAAPADQLPSPTTAALNDCPLEDYDFQQSIASRPEKFLVPDDGRVNELVKLTKWLFDMAKKADPSNLIPLPELYAQPTTATSTYTKEDLETVWEQIQLLNKPMVKYLKKEVEKVMKRGDVEPMDDLDEEHLDGLREELSGEDEEDMMEDLEGMEGLMGDDDDDDDEGDGDRDSDLDEDDEDQDLDLDDEEEEEQDYASDDLSNDDRPQKKRPKLDYINSDDDSDSGEAPTTQRKGRVTELDDPFFSLEEMEKFAERGEERDMNRVEGEEVGDDWDLGLGFLGLDPDEIKGSDDEDDDEDSGNANEIYYNDFFDPPAHMAKQTSSNTVDLGSKKGGSRKDSGVRFNTKVDSVKFSKDLPPSDIQARKSEDEGVEEEGDELLNEEEDSEEEQVEFEDEEEEESQQRKKSNSLFDLDDDDDQQSGQILSRFEKEQQRLQKEIESLETDLVGEKKWTLRGEVTSKARPANSLLEETMEVEHASRPTPVITEETTQTLDELIKSRILSQVFDDVERKVDPRDHLKPFDPEKRGGLDETKSSKSLADLYESEYTKKASGGGGGEGELTEKQKELGKAHKEIGNLLTDLFSSLDSLSQFHFKPSAPMAELEITPAASVPALTLEEVIPSTVADATLATPQEVYKGSVSKSSAEMDASDKRKARKAAKRKLGVEKKEKELHRQALEMLRNGGGSSLAKKDLAEKALSGSKVKAMEHLMKQGNVTIVKSGGGVAGRSARELESGKGKGKKGKVMKAGVLEAGGKIGEAKKSGGKSGAAFML
ncbi:u3 small nucleolar ribonucleoprotein MPP10 [Chytridiales sp. JEL 0842]|nr:u3 small nucleolar ribonucleoprotein MPP10 [Chytridiales sp. JEL 0842]